MGAGNLYYIRHCFCRQANAGAKPSIDVEDVLQSMGAHAIGLPRAYFKFSKAVHLRDILNHLAVRCSMPRNKTVLLQYPAQYRIKDLARLAHSRGNKVVVMIHDINTLRGRAHADYPEVLEQADILIAHTPAMKEWLENRFPGIKVIIPGMFDYIQPDPPHKKAPQSPAIVFAGNLGKSKFLNQLDFKGPTRLVLYGVGLPEEVAHKKFVEYRGSCMPEEIPERIAGETFGLVWDGESIHGCTGPMGQYLKYNAPYKLSSYIAAGIPVIIWSQMGIAGFVLEHGLGIAVDTLEDIEEKLAAISEESYSAMRENARAMQKLVSEGYFARTAIEKALS